VKNACRDTLPFHIKIFAWLNIGIQTVFPLTAAFTPIMAGAGSDTRFLQDRQQSVLQTSVYILSGGETTASVAAKFNISPAALRKMNQLRTFAHGFDNLQPGDELDVPLVALPKVHWDIAPSASGDRSEDRKAQQQKIASFATQAGGWLANHPDGDTTASLVRGAVTGAASSEVQQWLSQFGTARVQLGADSHFSLENSQLDLLIPWYEQKNSLFFTQSSLHRTDDRTQGNLGVGYRWFTKAWMVGGNTFVDYDFSRNHARTGLGVEYWRDFVKLGVNSYYRLTSWKTSPDLEDYEERPANGWDLRAQAWLPALPQLGGKLIYEQYYGSEVALFGKDSRQRDPHAMTAGINYTPVPLLTLSAEQRQGKAGESDTRFGVEMSYRLGVPWSQQIDPEAVAATRSLAGSRYDLVERNNNIVLEYRKKEVIRLKTADLVTGYAGEQKSLGVSVTSKYGLERIDWSAAPLILAGGKIVQRGDGWTVVLPDRKAGADAVNSYTLSAVAVDKKGNVSGRADTQVTVTQAAIDIGKSTLTPGTLSLPADGKAQGQLLLKVNDGDGKPVDIAADEITLERVSKLRGSSGATVTAFTRKAAGEYGATLTAGTLPEAFELVPSARNARFPSASVVLTADSATAMLDSLSVVNDRAIADGAAQNTVKARVVDAQNNPVPGQNVAFSVGNEASVAASMTTEKDGSVLVPVTSTRAGEATLTANINGKGNKEVRLIFRPDQNTAHIVEKDLSVLPDISVADGKTAKTVSAKVTDAQGNPVPDVLVTFSADNHASVAQKAVKADAQGRASTQLTSVTAGIARVTASVNQTPTVRDTTFIGDGTTALVAAVRAGQAAGVADGKTAAVFRALIKDQNGNPLPGIPVDWKSDKDGSLVIFSQGQTLTDDRGIAETAITSIRAYNNVIVTASTNASAGHAEPFTFVADRQNPVIAQFTSDKKTLTANGSDAATLTVKVEDANGNPLSGININLASKEGAVTVPSRLMSDAGGVATAILTTLRAGDVTVSASLENGSDKTLSLQAMADTQTASVIVKPDVSFATAGQPSPVTLTAVVTDAQNNPLSDTSVAWQADHNQLNGAVTVTNAKGEALVALSGTQAAITTVTAVLYNGKKGSAQVTFGPGNPAQGHSTLTVTPQSITADGKSTALATLLLRDQWDNPVAVQPVNWHAEKQSGISFDARELGNGLYQANVIGTKEGAWNLFAQSGNVNLQTVLGLLASQDSALVDSVSLSGSDTAKADGVETVMLRAQVKDKNGNTKLKGLTVGWDTSLGTLSSHLSQTDENGVAEIKLSSRFAGLAQVSAMLGGSTSVDADKKITFTAGAISADKSSVSLSPASIIAERERATLRVTARDAQGNLLSGLDRNITLNFSVDLVMSVSTFTEVSNGVYETTVTGKKAGTAEISALIDGKEIARKVNLTLRADNDSAMVSGSIQVTPPSAVVGDIVTYRAVLTDKNDNVLGAGIPVTWSANEGSKLEAQVTQTDSSGTAQVTLTRLRAGTAKVQIVLPSGTVSAPDVIFSPGSADESRSELTLSPSVIVAGKETATLALLLRDKNGNLLADRNVSGSSDNAAVSIGASQQSANAAGLYAMTVSGIKAGSATLSVKVEDKTFAQTRVLTVKGNTESWKFTGVVPDRTSMVAGEAKGVTYSATVTDALGNRLPGVVVSWQLQGQAESYPPTSRTDENGTAKVTVTSHTAGLLQMTAWLDENNHRQADGVTVLPAEMDGARSTFDANKTTIGSDGKEAVKLTVHLEDRYGNTLPGQSVKITGAETLPGFTLTAVVETGDGNYTAQGTSTAKGEATLGAAAGNKKVGGDINVTVGAITPDLRFANAQQSAVYTKNYLASQPVEGMPSGVQQIWSSSDPDVAKVDGNSGKVTLLKSGKVKVTVYTPGNTQYNPAMASYELNVNRADPKLKAGEGNPITATWADGKSYSIRATFDNTDVGSELIATYESSDNGVVSVDSVGMLKAVKPGITKVSVRTPETDRFNAASIDVPYVLGKGTVEVNFATKEESTTDEATFTVQTPVNGLPADASVAWQSSDTSVINIAASGVVHDKPGKGRARLTLSVAANDYYNASTGYYDVKVYTRPAISMGTVSYTGKGATGSSGTWTPVFVDDRISVSWSTDVASEFSKPESVTVYLKDSGGNVLSTQNVTSPAGSQTTTMDPKTTFWGKNIYVELVAKGYETLTNSVTSKTISVRNLNPAQIWTTFTVRSHVETRTSNGGGTDSSCQASYLGYSHWNNAVATGDKITFGGKTLLSPMSIGAKVTATQNGSDRSGNFPNRYNSVNTDQSVAFGSVEIAKECWNNHVGGYRVGVVVNYGGSDYTYYADESHGWGGNGDGMYADRVDSIHN
jgi:adhesin/invasin